MSIFVNSVTECSEGQLLLSLCLFIGIQFHFERDHHQSDSVTVVLHHESMHPMQYCQSNSLPGNLVVLFLGNYRLGLFYSSGSSLFN